MQDTIVPPPLPQIAASTAMVPAEFAEKAMASLMQLHTELMDEKERRVVLYRQLMEREQALAELKMYVKLLEERAAPAASVPVPPPVAPVTFDDAPHVAAAPPQMPPVPPRIDRPRVDGWKTW